MSTGVMQEIRDRLAGGQSSTEVIAQGFAPPTVYKVQRQLRRDQNGAMAPAAPAQPSPELAEARQRIQELEEEVASLEADVDSMEEEAKASAELQTHLEVLMPKLNGLLGEVTQLRAARDQAVERASALGANAQEAGRLRHRVTELESQLQGAASSHA